MLLNKERIGILINKGENVKLIDMHIEKFARMLFENCACRMYNTLLKDLPDFIKVIPSHELFIFVIVRMKTVQNHMTKVIVRLTIA